jgi:membrane protein involved in colicin uptake
LAGFGCPPRQLENERRKIDEEKAKLARDQEIREAEERGRREAAEKAERERIERAQAEAAAQIAAQIQSKPIQNAVIAPQPATTIADGKGEEPKFLIEPARSLYQVKAAVELAYEEYIRSLGNEEGPRASAYGLKDFLIAEIDEAIRYSETHQ